MNNNKKCIKFKCCKTIDGIIYPDGIKGWAIVPLCGKWEPPNSFESQIVRGRKNLFSHQSCDSGYCRIAHKKVKELKECPNNN